MRDMKSSIDVQTTLIPAVRTASANGTTIDLKGYDSATAVVHTGAIVASGNQTAKLQESDDDSNWDDVAAADLLGAFSSALSASAVERVGYVGSMRYIRVVITHNSGTSVATAAEVIRGKSHINEDGLA